MALNSLSAWLMIIDTATARIAVRSDTRRATVRTWMESAWQWQRRGTGPCNYLRPNAMAEGLEPSYVLRKGHKTSHTCTDDRISPHIFIPVGPT